MTTTVSPGRSSVITADYVNPVISCTRSVFEMMLNCVPVRTGLKLRTADDARHEVSAVIGVSGKAAGTIVLNLSENAACQVLEQMVGVSATTVNREVCDAVGELTNMIAGSAKAQLAKYELSISLPNVISGSDHVVHFPSNVQPMIISFDSEIGPFSIEVGFTGI